MENSMHIIWIALGVAAIALIYAMILARSVSQKEVGTERMHEVATSIREGAMAFIKREYKVLSIFVVIVAVIFAFVNEGAVRLISLAFVAGAFCSSLAGFIGMRVATKANVRTANAARESLTKALGVAFNGGAVMGLCVVGLGRSRSWRPVFDFYCGAWFGS